MRKSIILLLINTTLLMFIISCDSMISDVDAPDSDPRLVVTGFLSAGDDMISISVSKSRPLYEEVDLDEPYEVVNNATVEITSGQNSVILLFNPENHRYQIPSSSMPLVGGNSYSLAVTTPDGFYATASCSIPAGIAPEAEITGIDSSNNYGNNNIKVSLRFRDLPGIGDFYRINAGIVVKNEYDQNYYFSETGFERGDQFVSDKNKEDEYFLFRTYEIYYNEASEDSLYISLYHTDVNYYNYHRSLNSNNDGGNPFAEPVPVFSNIQGGLGVFAGVNGKTSIYSIGNN